MASFGQPAHGQRFYVLALSEPGSHPAVADLPMGLREMASVPIDHVHCPTHFLGLERGVQLVLKLLHHRKL